LACFLPCLFGFILPSMESRARSQRRTACSANVRRIGEALHAYHEQYGSFPPAWLADSDGQPMHSWRVLILPYLGEEGLYAQYNFDEPWDGPANSRLAGRMPAVYGCPDDAGAAKGETSYVAVTGPGFVFDGTKATSLDQITDGPEETILFVEAAGSGISWMAPQDFADGAVEYELSQNAGSVIRGNHDFAGHACMADGFPMFMETHLETADLKARFTIAGAEKPATSLDLNPGAGSGEAAAPKDAAESSGGSPQAPKAERRAP
jgi:hypothetical protein